MRKILPLIVALLVLSACTTGVPSQTKTPAQIQKVKLGVLAPLSGDIAALGAEIRKALDYGLIQVNKKAAAQGYEFQLVYEDGKCAGAEAVTGFQKLTDIDGVKFIIGGSCSSETLATAPLAQEKGIVLLSPTSSNPDVESAGDYVFTLSYSDSLVGQEIAKELSQYGTLAIVSEQNDYNVGMRKVVKDHLDSATTIVADETFSRGGTDFRNILEKIASKNPDVIFLNPNPGITGQSLLKQMAEIPALSQVKLVSHYAYLADESRAGAFNKAEGMVIFDAPALSSPAFEAVFEAIVAEKGTLENLGKYYVATTLDDLNIMTQVIMEQGPDPVRVKDALRKDTFKGYTGTLYFGENNFVQGIPAARYTVKSGKALIQQ